MIRSGGEGRGASGAERLGKVGRGRVNREEAGCMIRTVPIRIRKNPKGQLQLTGIMDDTLVLTTNNAVNKKAPFAN